MGKVRTETIKRVARELAQSYPGRFTGAFEENKKTVEELVDYKSKKVRNLIAGYVTRIQRIEETRAAPTVVEQTQSPQEMENG